MLRMMVLACVLLLVPGCRCNDDPVRPVIVHCAEDPEPVAAPDSLP